MDLYEFCFIMFLALSPVILLIKFWCGRPRWWLVILLITILGWFFWLSAFVFYQLHISDLIAQGAELPDGWDSDGAAGVFALLFGWLISIIYFLPWFAVYGLADTTRRFIRGSS